MKVKQLNKQKLMLGGLLTIIVISSFLYTPVIGDSNDDSDEDDDGIDDDFEDENKREIEVEYEDEEAQIESKRYIDGIENKT